MTKRISDLSFDELRAEAARAWSEAASRALEAGLKVEGTVRASARDDDARTDKSRKTRKNGARAA